MEMADDKSVFEPLSPPKPRTWSRSYGKASFTAPPGLKEGHMPSCRSCTLCKKNNIFLCEGCVLEAVHLPLSCFGPSRSP